MIITRTGVHSLSIRELLDKQFHDAPAWIGPNILPKGGTLLFGGHAKIGKSFILFELARAISTGTPVFGYPLMVVPQPARVLVVEQELGERGSQRRLQKILAEDYKISQYAELLDKNLHIVSQLRHLKLNDPMVRQALVTECLRLDINVLLLDPISKMHSYDENNNTEMERLMGHLEEIRDRCQQNGLAIVFSHHFGKPPREDTGIDPFSPYNFRGASKLFDAPDSIVTCVRRNAATRPDPMWYVDTQWILRQGEPLENDGKFSVSVNELYDLRVRLAEKARKIEKLTRWGG